MWLCACSLPPADEKKMCTVPLLFVVSRSDRRRLTPLALTSWDKSSAERLSATPIRALSRKNIWQISLVIYWFPSVVRNWTVNESAAKRPGWRYSLVSFTWFNHRVSPVRHKTTNPDISNSPAAPGCNIPFLMKHNILLLCFLPCGLLSREPLLD